MATCKFFSPLREEPKAAGDDVKFWRWSDINQMRLFSNKETLSPSSFRLEALSNLVCVDGPVFFRLLNEKILVLIFPVSSSRTHNDGTHVSLNSSHLLLRGCVVRNTETVIGLVIYAGRKRTKRGNEKKIVTFSGT